MSSIFSKIITREIPGTIIYEDDMVIAFLDINPVNPGHTLVVPKEEKINVLESSEDDIKHVLMVGRKLAPAIVKAVGADGFHFSFNAGEAAGQTVFHTHMHIIPRFNNDGFGQWEQQHAETEALMKIAEKIKVEL